MPVFYDETTGKNGPVPHPAGVTSITCPAGIGLTKVIVAEVQSPPPRSLQSCVLHEREKGSAADGYVIADSVMFVRAS